MTRLCNLPPPLGLRAAIKTPVMTAVHLGLLALSPTAGLQSSLQRLPAGEECHTEAGGRLRLNQRHLHMQDKKKRKPGEGSPPEALYCPLQAVCLTADPPSTMFTLPGREQKGVPGGGGLCADVGIRCGGENKSAKPRLSRAVGGGEGKRSRPAGVQFLGFWRSTKRQVLSE